MGTPRFGWKMSACTLCLLLGCKGPPGEDGMPGAPGSPGQPGMQGSSGMTGAPGAGYVPLEADGLVGFVRDTAGDPVIGARVYLVPATDIPTDPIDFGSIANARDSTVDEPLEATIAVRGAGYTTASSDANGFYDIPSVGLGRYFIVVMPDPADTEHLPGGSRCRTAVAQTAMLGKQLDIKLSTRPPASAEFVGNSACLNCHGMLHWKQTLHALTLRIPAKLGPLQLGDRFADWNRPLDTLFTASGTTLYVFGYNRNAAQPDWEVSATDPGTGVDFTARLYSDGSNRYFMDLVNVPSLALKTAGMSTAAGERYGTTSPRWASSAGRTESPDQKTSACGWPPSAMSRFTTPVLLVSSVS
jgi:hypothetical protein